MAQQQKTQMAQLAQQMRNVHEEGKKQMVQQQRVAPDQVVLAPIQNVDRQAPVMLDNGETMSAQQAARRLEPHDKVAVQNAFVHPETLVAKPQSAPSQLDLLSARKVQQLPTEQFRPVQQHLVDPLQHVLAPAGNLVQPTAVLPEGDDSLVHSQSLNPDELVVAPAAAFAPGDKVLLPQVAPLHGAQSPKQQTVQMQAVNQLHPAQLIRQPVENLHPNQVVQTKVQNVSHPDVPVLPLGSEMPVTAAQVAATQGGQQKVAVKAGNVQQASEVFAPQIATLRDSPQQVQQQMKHIQSAAGPRMQAVPIEHARATQVVQSKLGQIVNPEALVLIPGQNQLITAQQAVDKGVKPQQKVLVQAVHVQPQTVVKQPASAPLHDVVQQIPPMMPMIQQAAKQVDPHQVVITQAQNVIQQAKVTTQNGQTRRAQQVLPNQPVAVQVSQVKPNAVVQVKSNWMQQPY